MGKMCVSVIFWLCDWKGFLVGWHHIVGVAVGVRICATCTAWNKLHKSRPSLYIAVPLCVRATLLGTGAAFVSTNSGNVLTHAAALYWAAVLTDFQFQYFRGSMATSTLSPVSIFFIPVCWLLSLPAVSTSTPPFLPNLLWQETSTGSHYTAIHQSV